MKSWRSSAFLIDQGISSVITFFLFIQIAKNGGAELVGVISIIQAIVLIALTAARALGLDVWASRGSIASERRAAISVALLLPPLVLFINGGVIMTLGTSSPVLTIYWLVSPVILVLDTVRIVLLHADKSWLSLLGQICTLFALFVTSIYSSNLSIMILAYAFGIVLTCTLGFIGLKLVPPFPSPRYAVTYRRWSLPFLAEVSLGSIVNQGLFLVLAALASVSTAGELRIAQTLVGPMSVIHAGIAPQILRRLGKNIDRGPHKVIKSGTIYGGVLALVSFVGVVVWLFILHLQISGQSVLTHLIGKSNDHLIYVVAACGVALAFNGLILGTGAAARVVGSTTRLNKARVVLVPIQVIIIYISAVSNDSFIAACGFGATSAITALISVCILRSGGDRRKESNL